ncbi:MAG: hypothetical protein AAF487_08835 [Bacteroidota bacterium]
MMDTLSLWAVKPLDYFARIFSLLLILLCSTMQAQNDTLIHIDFADAMPEGWESIDLNQNDFNWVHTYVGIEAVYNPAIASELNSNTSENGWMMFHAAFYNTDSLNSNTEADPVLEMNSILTSPEFDFSLNADVHLSLIHYFRTLSSPINGSLELGVSTDSINWQIFDLHTGSDSPLNLENGVEQISLDLSQLIGLEPQAWIRFHFRNLAWHFWSIDDIVFSSDPLVSSLADTGIYTELVQPFPNPVKDVLFLDDKCQNSNYRLYSRDGILLEMGQVMGFVDLSQWPSGMYLIEIDSCNLKRKIIRL